MKEGKRQKGWEKIKHFPQNKFLVTALVFLSLADLLWEGVIWL